MNDEQYAVLTAVARLEEHRGGPVDEYTVARAAGILATDLSGSDYAQSQERSTIRQIFDELDEAGLLRVERTGYWRPRTSLAGRRALESPPAVPPLARPRLEATTPLPAVDVEAREASSGWPVWWPAALRFGDVAPRAPLLAALAGLTALLLLSCVVLAVRARSGGGATPSVATGTVEARATGAAGSIGAGAGAGTAPATTGGTTTVPGGATTAPSATTPRLTSTPAPTPTPRSTAPIVIVANTNNEGAILFKTPAGERSRYAVSEGTELEDIGPDEQDTRGRTWKHVRYGNFEGWILAEYVVPATP